MELVDQGRRDDRAQAGGGPGDGDVIDSMFMSKKALCDFYEEQMEDAYKTGVMFSLHVKATMMKVSHPIVFGHAVKVFYKDAFAKHQKLFDELGVNVNNGLSDLYDKIESLPGVAARRDHPRPARLPRAPSRAGHGRLGQGHLELPLAQRRHRGRLDARDDPRWAARCTAPTDGPRTPRPCTRSPPSPASTRRSSTSVRPTAQFDPTTMGTVPNVGLMAQQAEEYGSHDKTFEIPEDGVANIVDLDTGEVLLTQNVEAGDIWRMCIVKDAPIRDWVKLAVTRGAQLRACRCCSGWTRTVRTRTS